MGNKLRRYAVVMLFSLTITSPLLAADIALQSDPTKPSEAQTIDVSSWKVLKQSPQLTVRINPAVNLATYTKVQVGSITYTGPKKAITQRQSEELASNLREYLSSQLNSNGLLQGPSIKTQTLVLQAQITRVRRSRPWLNVLTTAAIFVPVDLGVAATSVSLIDAQTNTPVLLIETERCGQIYQVIPSFQTLGQSRLLLKKESRMITKELQELKATASSSPLLAEIAELH